MAEHPRRREEHHRGASATSAAVSEPRPSGRSGRGRAAGRGSLEELAAALACGLTPARLGQAIAELSLIATTSAPRSVHPGLGLLDAVQRLEQLLGERAVRVLGPRQGAQP